MGSQLSATTYGPRRSEDQRTSDTLGLCASRHKSAKGDSGPRVGGCSRVVEVAGVEWCAATLTGGQARQLIGLAFKKAGLRRGPMAERVRDWLARR